MNIDILDSLNSTFGSPLIKQASSLLDEPETGTRSALRSTFPALLAGLMHKSTTASGAADAYRYVTSEAVDSGITGQLSNILGNRGSLDSLLANGERLTGTMLGNRSSGLANAISQVAGIRPGSATALLSMGVPVLLGMLKKHVTQGGLNAGGLANLLFSQRGSLEKAGLDNRIASALGIGSLSSLLGSVPASANERFSEASATPRAPVRAATQEKRNWWPWALAAGVAALAVWGLSSRNNMDRTSPAMASRTVPAEHPTETPAPMAQTPAETTAAPATAAPERTRLASLPAKVYFETGQANLGAQGQEVVAAVASTVKEAGGAVGAVAITGFTDRTGNPDQNLELAKERAEVVKDELVAEGLSETDVVMKPPTFVTGSGSDAEARRVEIAVEASPEPQQQP